MNVNFYDDDSKGSFFPRWKFPIYFSKPSLAVPSSGDLPWQSLVIYITSSISPKQPVVTASLLAYWMLTVYSGTVLNT